MEKWKIRPQSSPPKKKTELIINQICIMTSERHLALCKISSRYNYPSTEICENAHQVTRVVFTVLRKMQTLSSDENSVCLSVCLSNAYIVTKRKKDLPCFIPHEISFSLVFWEEEWLVEGDPFYLKFWVNRPALERNRRFWTDIRS